MIASMCSSLMKPAPNHRNGVVVPRPSEMFSDSISPVPGYTIAVSRVGMFGEGSTHGRSSLGGSSGS